jgi:hypothetical protein
MLDVDEDWMITAVDHAKQSDSTSCGLFCLKVSERIN